MPFGFNFNGPSPALRRFVKDNFGWDFEDWEPWEIAF